ncbi:hypothetical protein [Sinomonas cyclohexanicum]|uniref:hypothetical protein n=1 Tax=Sinomonas cyclohexanicum TaxID=322009 RepID=UPI001E4A6B90|nr:hypothetical protein [Corynebacterium cyclohexanicum]
MKNPVVPAAQARLGRAVELRVKGWTLQQIADELGYSSLGSLSGQIRKVLRGRLEERGEALLQLELERLDKAAATADALMDSRQTPLTRARGIEAMVKVSERRSRMLGLDHAERRADAVAAAAVDRATLLSIAAAVNRAFARVDLTAEQVEALRLAVAAELEALDTAAPVDVVPGEVADD